MREITASIITEEHMLYERSPEFQAYLLARIDWVSAHDAYAAQRTDANRVRESVSYEFMQSKLAAARALPIHKQAFGW